MGMDSLMALELKNRLEAEVGVAIPVVSIIEGITIDGLVSQILAELQTEFPTAVGHEVAGVQATVSELENLTNSTQCALENLDVLSEAQIDAMLAELEESEGLEKPLCTD
jgi:hypothetical protein